jgi:hypothetical protein
MEDFMVAVAISNNTFVLWQTLFAITASTASIAAGFGWLNKRLAKKSDIDKLRQELSEVKDGNSKENARIISLVEDLKESDHRTESRLDRHIEFGTHTRGVQRNPLDGNHDE